MKILFFILVIICISNICYADTIKGSIDKVDIRNYKIIVNGNMIDVSKALVFTQNEMNVTKAVIIRDLKDHKGEEAVCYGSIGKDNVFNAYKVKILERHR